MTREEAIDTLKAFKAMLKIYPKRRKQKETVVQLETALDMAIKSLKTDGCKDAFRTMFAEADIKAKQKKVGAVVDGIVGHETIQKSAEKAKENINRPHGRLIDADALKEYIFSDRIAMKNSIQILIKKIIDNAPTVSADEQIQSMVEKRVAELVHLNHELEQQLADRPHGEWIVVAYQKDGEEYIRSCTCSECGSKSALRTNYCPNCGAKMGGDTK